MRTLPSAVPLASVLLHGYVRRYVILAATGTAVAAVLFAIVSPPPTSVAVAQAPARKRVLLLTHNTFYKHTSLDDIEKAVPELGKAGGFSVTSLEGYKQGPDTIDLSMGHRDDLWSGDATFREHILGALRWGVGLEN